ncbi:MAG: ribosome maturation factor RimP [Alphaproteobacteria bacterium]|nr:ribosome maturation factor RimP [Alphaproteobacteria bacterium]
MKTKIEQIEDLITPTLREEGITVVDVRFYSRGNTNVLDIRLENLDETNITIESCGKASRTISALLDVEDIVPEAFLLEVGSAGLDRPLKTLEDFKRFSGRNAKIETDVLVEERKRFKGVLGQVQENLVEIKMEEKTYLIPFASIEKARLVI